MLTIIAAIASAAPAVSGAIVSVVPLVGTTVAAGTTAIGTAVGGALVQAGASATVGGIAARTTTAALTGTAIGAVTQLLN